MENKIIVITHGEEEWDGVYINGQLVYEAHTLDPVQLLRALGIDFTVREVDQEYMNARGGYPKNLKDCKFTKD